MADAAKKRENHPMLGKTHSEESKAKMSEAQKGNKNWLGKTHSEETKVRISEAMKGKKRSKNAGIPCQPIEVLDLYTGIQTVYTSMGEAARALDVPTGSVRSYFSRNTQKPFKGQYKLSRSSAEKI